MQRPQENVPDSELWSISSSPHSSKRTAPRFFMKNQLSKSIFTSEKDFKTIPSIDSFATSPPVQENPVFQRPKLPKSDSTEKLSREARTADANIGQWRTSDPRDSHQVGSTSWSGRGSKRPLEGNIVSSPPRKKLRPSFRSALDTEPFSSGFHTNNTTPISPLFFSNRNRRRPGHLLNFGDVEATDIMLKTTAREEAGVTTLKIARGNISSPDGRASAEPRSIPRSPQPNIATDNAGLKLLEDVGICELLEQDERPTFLFDLANSANLQPGPLNIIFANQALRANEGLYSMVIGNAQNVDSPLSTFPEFKTWAISFVKNNEAMVVSLPSFLFGGVRWECKTLRKRLRLISGISSPTISNLVSQSSYDVASNASLPNSSAITQKITQATTSSGEIESEPRDYFGDIAVLPPPNAAVERPIEARKISMGNTLAEQRPVLQKSLSEIIQTLGTSPSLASECVIAAGSAGFRDMTLTGAVSDNFFDWTRLPLTASLPRHIQVARSIEWEKTSLGPIENWGFSLRAMCNLVMGSPHPAGW